MAGAEAHDHMDDRNTSRPGSFAGEHSLLHGGASGVPVGFDDCALEVHEQKHAALVHQSALHARRCGPRVPGPPAVGPRRGG